MRSDLRQPIVGARDGLEMELADIWSTVLGQPVGRDANFFECGGTSFSAVRLWSLVQERFGLDLPVVTLFDAPTLAQVADVVRHGAPISAHECLVRIRSSGTELPVFCFHALPGTVIRYWPFAAALPAQIPVYGLQSQGLNPKFEPHKTIESMAEAYVTAILSAQHSGPYYLLGYSMGGVLAYEVAAQLRTLGHDIGLLGMIDAPPVVEVDSAMDYATKLLVQNGLRLNIDVAPLLALDRDERLDQLLKLGIEANSLPPGYGREHVQRMLEMYYFNGHALAEYELQRSSERITMFRSDDPGRPCLGWSDYGPEVAVHHIGGDHFGIMEPGNIERIAAVVADLRGGGFHG
ncbi:thioesterase domain-containing protein [Streptomyces aureus]